MRYVSVCLLFFAVFLTSLLPIYAHEDFSFPQASEGQINEALGKVVPVRFLISSPLYLLISAKETVNRFFQPSAVAKAEFDMILAGKKLKEVFLLLEKGDIKNAGKTLALYSSRVDKMTDQFERARSQNQEVSSLVDLMAEDLRVHETIFSAIDKRWQQMEEDHDFDFLFSAAVSSHAGAVLAIDNVKPGLADRFTTDGNGTTQEEDPTPSPLPYSQEATPTVKPKRIIL